MAVNSSALQAVEWCNPGTSFYGFCYNIPIIARGDDRDVGPMVCVCAALQAVERFNPSTSSYGFCCSIAIIASGDRREMVKMVNWYVCVCVCAFVCMCVHPSVHACACDLVGC